MPRQVKEKRLDTRTARAKLKPSPTPYFRSLGPDLHLGYRKGATVSKWVARVRAAGRYRTIELGHADDAVDADGTNILTFFQAQARAGEIVADKRAASSRYTVRRAIDDYIQHLDGRPVQETTRQRLNAYVDKALAETTLDDLGGEALESWMRRMGKSPARASTSEGAKQNFRTFDPEDEEHRRRRQASANRVCTMLKAALNLAFRRGKVGTDAAWRRLKPFKNVAAPAARYLTTQQATRLINATDPEFRDMVKAALLTGARFSELARLRVDDFNPDAGTLQVRRSKSGKSRHITLTDEAADYFAEIAAGKPGDGRLIPQIKDKTGASRRVRLACGRSRISPAVKFHELRHTWASLAVMNGVPLLVVAKNLGHRDTRMVELHYGHLAQDYVAATIREFGPRFGLGTTSNIRVLK
jgi:integrase